MQPHSPQSQTPNPYEFITNPPKPGRRGLLGGASGAQRLLIIVGVVAVSLIIVLAVMRSLTNKETVTESFFSIAQQQNELVRVADIGDQKASNDKTKGLALNAKLSLKTDQADLLNYFKQNGVKVDNKRLGLTKNSVTDKRLESADTTGTFDATFREVMKEQLTTYQNSLKDTFSSTNNGENRLVLDRYYKHSQLLLTQVGE
jgi:hypothetical protein